MVIGYVGSHTTRSAPWEGVFASASDKTLLAVNLASGDVDPLLQRRWSSPTKLRVCSGLSEWKASLAGTVCACDGRRAFLVTFLWKRPICSAFLRTRISFSVFSSPSWIPMISACIGSEPAEDDLELLGPTASSSLPKARVDVAIHVREA